MHTLGECGGDTADAMGFGCILRQYSARSASGSVHGSFLVYTGTTASTVVEQYFRLLSKFELQVHTLQFKQY